MTAPRYELINDYGGSKGKIDMVSTSPYWVLCVVPLAVPLSFDRQNMASVKTSDNGAGARLRDQKLVVTSDCEAMTISASKESHTKQLVARIAQADHNYLVEILPGDWIMAWIVSDEERGRDLVKRIKKDKQANDFKDGLKFVGRVQSIRKQLQRSPDGVLTAGYTLNATAFQELNTQLFYDTALQDVQFAGKAGLSTWFAQIGLDVTELFEVTAKNGVQDNVHKLIPAFLELLLGKGASSNLNPLASVGIQAATGLVGPPQEGREPQFAYLVPKEVGDLLGKTSRDVSKASGILAYVDILETVVGVQKYSNTNAQSNPYRVFLPDIAKGQGTSYQFTGVTMMGAFLPLMPQFTNRPVWSVLQQFLNPAVNEMFTSLRVNDKGKIVPTLTVRQIPFTTDVFADKYKTSMKQGDYGPAQKEVVVTPFLSLPRWVMHPALLHAVDIGRSDATRINFVHVFGQNSYSTNNISITEQLVNNPPVRDDLDIQRSGLRSYMTTVACDASNQVGFVPRIWMEFVADYMMGSQFTLNGTMVCTGIHSPICEGDNLEFDHVVYHIEGYTHSCSISEDGTRTFTTQLQLTNGLRSDENSEFVNFSDTDTEDKDKFPLYPGIVKGDNTQYDPGTTIDREDTDQDEDANDNDTGSVSTKTDREKDKKK